MNILQIAGRLGADAESRVTPNGTKVTTLRVATNQKRGGQDETIWWRVTLWGDRFDKILPYMKKGSAVIVVGELNKPEIWTNRDGQAQVNLEMRAEFIKFNPFGGDRPQEPGQQQAGQQPSAAGMGDNFGGAPAGQAPQSFSPAGQAATGQAAPPVGDLEDGMPF